MLRALSTARFGRHAVGCKPKQILKPNNSEYVSPICIQSASICSKHTRDRSVKKPAPWPYKEKKYTEWHSRFYLDDTLARFDENTQLIAVEGNIAVGKTAFAKHLAEELEMLYIPEPDLDQLYILENGFDLRTLDPVVPEPFKSTSIKKFYENPHNSGVGKFQFMMFQLRFEQYLEALAHILNTGQGVVMDRCVYSDFIFMEAMYNAGYLSNDMKKYYNEVKDSIIFDIELKPTLIIYLDCPVDTCLKRIQERNIDYEMNSKVLTKTYLEDIDHLYKHRYLKEMKVHSEMIVYDWSEYGDPEAVVEDIERLDYGRYDKFDLTTDNWRRDKREIWEHYRLWYTNNRLSILIGTLLPKVQVKEIFPSPQDRRVYKDILVSVANSRFEKGFNFYLGDKGYYFNYKKNNYWDAQKFRLDYFHY